MTKVKVIHLVRKIFLQYEACLNEGYDKEAYETKDNVYEDLLIFIKVIRETES